MLTKSDFRRLFFLIDYTANCDVVHARVDVVCLGGLPKWTNGEREEDIKNNTFFSFYGDSPGDWFNPFEQTEKWGLEEINKPVPEIPKFLNPGEVYYQHGYSSNEYVLIVGNEQYVLTGCSKWGFENPEQKFNIDSPAKQVWLLYATLTYTLRSKVQPATGYEYPDNHYDDIPIGGGLIGKYSDDVEESWILISYYKWEGTYQRCTIPCWAVGFHNVESGDLHSMPNWSLFESDNTNTDATSIQWALDDPPSNQVYNGRNCLWNTSLTTSLRNDGSNWPFHWVGHYIEGTIASNWSYTGETPSNSYTGGLPPLIGLPATELMRGRHRQRMMLKKDGILGTRILTMDDHDTSRWICVGGNGMFFGGYPMGF